MAASAAATEIAYIREILCDISVPQMKPTILYVDNTVAEELAKDRKVTQRSRHVTRRQLNVREYVADGIIIVKHVSTDFNISDVFTKPLRREVFEHHRNYLMAEAA